MDRYAFVPYPGMPLPPATISRSMRNREVHGRLMRDFNTLVVRDGLDPMTVHQAFLVIDEYRFHISPDCPGAEQWSDEYADGVDRERAWRSAEDDEGIYT